MPSSAKQCQAVPSSAQVRVIKLASPDSDIEFLRLLDTVQERPGARAARVAGNVSICLTYVYEIISIYMMNLSLIYNLVSLCFMHLVIINDVWGLP